MKWLDHIPPLVFRDVGDIIHVARDDHGKILVFDDGEYRVLNFNSPFEQSCMNTRYPFQLVHQYTQYMLLVLAFIAPGNISLFGLGGGSLLRTLHYLLPDCVFNVVELRQKVVDIATEYFHIPKTERVNIVVNDALNSLAEWKSNSTDIIFSDMYDAYHMVQNQTQQDFMEQCSRALTNKGWLVINLHSLPGNRAHFLETLHHVFPTVLLSVDTANTILLASNSDPDYVYPDMHRVTAVEGELNQNFKQLMSKIRPINFAPARQ